MMNIFEEAPDGIEEVCRMMERVWMTMSNFVHAVLVLEGDFSLGERHWVVLWVLVDGLEWQRIFSTYWTIVQCWMG
jgi:hypothetical protein